MNIKRAIAIATLGLAVLLGACEPPAPYEGPEGARRVAIFGDSITWAATPRLKQLNAALPSPNSVSWNAQPYLSTYHFQNNFIYVGAIDKPDVVVIATGTNDAANGITQQDFDSIRNALDYIKEPCLLWVNTRQEISADHGAWNYILYLHFLSVTNGRILDWDTYSNGHPNWIQSDNVHLSTAGNDAYAAWLTNEIKRGC